MVQKNEEKEKKDIQAWRIYRGVYFFTFEFNIHFDTDHYNEEQVMWEIANWIIDNGNSANFFINPYSNTLPWHYLGDGPHRYVEIHPYHPLYRLLDQRSRSSGVTNYLIFNGHISKGKIKVTHFGPLGSGKSNTLQDEFNSNTERYIKYVYERFDMKNHENKTE